MSNKMLQSNAKEIWDMLSKEGKCASFPWQGILGQTAEAKKTKINATIGQAFEENGFPMSLPSLTALIPNIPSDVLLYSPSHGRKDLREKWKKEIYRKNHSLDSLVSLPIVTNGLTHGLKLVSKLFVNPEERVILPDMMWLNYKRVFGHAELDIFPFFTNNKFNISGLESKISGEGQKYVVLLNFPNNPTGYTPTFYEVDQIIRVIQNSANKGNNLVVICDDAYFGLNYELGVFPESIFSKLANIHENVLAIKIDGATKEMFSWGFRVGFVTYGGKGMIEDVARELEDKTAGIIRGDNSSGCSLTQYLISETLSMDEVQTEQAIHFQTLKARYNTVKEALQDPKYKTHFKSLPFNSGYFMCIQLHKLHAEDVRKRLLQPDLDTGIITVGDNLLRVAYSSCRLSDIKHLFENVYNACETLSSL